MTSNTEDKNEYLTNTNDDECQLNMKEREVGYSSFVEAHLDAAPQTQYLWNQLRAACAVSVGWLILGFSMGFTYSLSDMETSFNASRQEISWLASSMPLSAIIGSLAGAPLIAYCGRRKAIIAATVPCLIGWILIASATNLYLMFTGRIVIGISLGIITVGSPIYIAESIHPDLRGALGILPATFCNGGILLATGIGIFFDWSQSAIFGVTLPLALLVFVFGIPETPRWYITKGRSQDSRNALQWLRGKNINIENEIRDITRFQMEANKKSGNVCANLFRLEYMPAVLICLGLIFFQQMCGVSTVIFYSSISMYRAFASYSASINLILPIIYLISNVIAVFLVDRIGRKILLYISSVTMTIALIIIGIYVHISNSDADMEAFQWLLITCLVIFILGHSIGFGPIPWLMLGEILPSNIRATAAALALVLNWALAVHIAKTLSNLINVLNAAGLFWFYAVMSFIGFLFVVFFVPETRGKSLEEIEKHLTGEPLDDNL